ncbi:hypothetical protein [Kordia jejudonensis]|uniref:hypothetical protein n=1 Tax=Kordia jejudonensis TaxID=1348245 RepID=UPI0006299445|nr:hypothetical protein [Kordia jejudonensis]
MKKRKMNLKKLTLQKRTISNLEIAHGGAQQTQIIVICNTLINTDILTITATTTNPPIISEQKTKCISCEGFVCLSRDLVTCACPFDPNKTVFC